MLSKREIRSRFPKNSVNIIFSFAKRIIPWMQLASEFTAAHLAARVLALASSLLLVRLLPVNEYGLFTLILSAFTFISTLSDLGITETLSFFRYRSVKKGEDWIQYFYSALKLRRRVFILVFILASLYVLYTGRQIEVGTEILVVAIIIIGVAAWFSIQCNIITFALRLEQHFRHTYILALSNEGAKLFVVGVIWLLSLDTALAAMGSVVVGALISVIIALYFFRIHFKRTVGEANTSQNLNRQLYQQILPTLPSAIFFAIQAPLIAWMAAYFGSVENVAQVGALGRLAVVIGLISGFTGSVFVPRLNIVKDDKQFLKYYFMWWLVIVAFGAAIFFVIKTIPEAILFILGDSYSGLHSELLISAAGAMTGVLAGYSWNISRLKGWVRHQPLAIPVLIIGQVILILNLDLSTTSGVLLFGVGTNLVGLGFQLAVHIHGFLLNNTSWETS